MKETVLGTTTFIEQQIIVEFWISYLDKNGIETGVLIKKLPREGYYLILAGIEKNVFALEEILKPKFDGEFYQLPFNIGSTDFPAINAMKSETFASFLQSFKRAFCCPESKKESE